MTYARLACSLPYTWAILPHISTASKDKVVANNYALSKAYISVFDGELKGKIKRYILNKLDIILKYFIALYLLLF